MKLGSIWLHLFFSLSRTRRLERSNSLFDIGAIYTSGIPIYFSYLAALYDGYIREAESEVSWIVRLDRYDTWKSASPYHVVNGEGYSLT